MPPTSSIQGRRRESIPRSRRFMSRLAKALEHPRFCTRASDSVRGAAARSGLDHAQLGTGGSHSFTAAYCAAFPQGCKGLRVTYHLIYTTTYLLNTEGTKIRANRSLAAIEASLENPGIRRWHVAPQFSGRISQESRSIAPRGFRPERPRTCRRAIDNSSCLGTRG